VKDRILDYLRRAGTEAGHEGPSCALWGLGVGKTSLGRSIARALGPTSSSVSLWWHGTMRRRFAATRRTYIGAPAGQIIQSIRRAGNNDPVLMPG